jgi:hypothetical protein
MAKLHVSIGLALVLLAGGCGFRHDYEAPLIRARLGDCESLAFIGSKSFVVQVEPAGDDGQPWAPDVAALMAVSRAVEQRNVCLPHVDFPNELPGFELTVVQVTSVRDGVATVVLFESGVMSEETPWLCHEVVVDDGCGAVWYGSVDITGACLSELRVNCGSGSH